jgi:hypothetical protein
MSWNNLLKRLDPDEEPLDGTALLVEFTIEPEWFPPLRMFPGSLLLTGTMALFRPRR